MLGKLQTTWTESTWLWYVQTLAGGFNKYVNKGDLVDKVHVDSAKVFLISSSPQDFKKTKQL